MERKPFGSTGVLLPAIGQGTWQLRQPGAAAQALRVGLELGMTHLDTAELYRGSEEALRDALRDVPRASVFLVSKVLPRNASYRGTLRACEQSLQRLGTDHLDAYLLHGWGSEPIAETMRAMAELADQGKTRFVGVSNLDAAQVDEAQAALGPRHRIACDQVLHHLRNRAAEQELLPFLARRGIALVGYSPFGHGDGGFPPPGSAEHRALEQVGARHGRTPRQVALRFLTRHANVFAIPKAEQAAHVRENAGGAGWALDAEDVERLDEAFPLPRVTAPGRA